MITKLINNGQPFGIRVKYHRLAVITDGNGNVIAVLKLEDLAQHDKCFEQNFIDGLNQFEDDNMDTPYYECDTEVFESYSEFYWMLEDKAIESYFKGETYRIFDNEIELAVYTEWMGGELVKADKGHYLVKIN